MPHGAAILREIGKLLLGVLYAALLLAIAPVSIWLVFGARTLVGRGLALLGVTTLAVGADLFLWFGRKAHRRLWGWSTVALTLVWLATGYLILRAAPTGRPPPGSPVRHGFAGGGRFDTFHPANVIPEIEQVSFGLSVAPWLDPVLTRRQSRRVAGFTRPIYEQMQRDPNFRALGSALGGAYDELLGRPRGDGHYYLYVPRRRAKGPREALLFLHGSGGNFKAYTWVWSRLAERRNLAVIAPSFALGDWSADGAPAAALKALDHAGGSVAIDPDRVFLAGLSNGGVGVCRLGATHGERFAGLIFLSPVLAGEVVRGEAFRERWRGRDVLVVTGGDDRRIPLARVRAHAAAMEAGGVDVREIVYPGEDHFLFFSQYRKVLEDVSGWMDDVAARRPGGGRMQGAAR